LVICKPHQVMDKLHWVAYRFSVATEQVECNYRRALLSHCRRPLFPTAV